MTTADHDRDRSRQLRSLALLLGLGLLVGLGALFALRPDGATDEAGLRAGDEMAGVERPADQGRAHLEPGQDHDYGTPAPTSGPHAPAAPPCGSYGEPLPLVAAVHALEHGVVVIWYEPDVGDEAATALGAIAGTLGHHVIVSPNPELEHPVVATAWDRRLSLDVVDVELVTEFAETYRERGPEKIPCPA